ncbi:hypothetical protein ACFLY3_03960 [Chloroflexota bacterium]
MKKEQQGEDQPEEFGRRKFIGGAGLIVGGAALLGVGSLVIYGSTVSKGDTAAEGTCTTTTTTTTTQENVEYWGECICPNCEISVPHPKGVPCRRIACPKCETLMVGSVSV